MNEFRTLVLKLIIVVGKFTRYSKNDDINSAFDSVLDDYYYEKEKLVIMISISNFYETIMKHTDEFTSDQFKDIQKCLCDIQLRVLTSKTGLIRNYGHRSLLTKHMCESINSQQAISPLAEELSKWSNI